jgi:beta-mannosidase
MLSLNGEWELYFRQERCPGAQWQTIPAQVPGNVELDLFRAGLDGDPFYGENIYNYRKYEFYEWRFERSFDMPACDAGKRLSLRFDGVNTYAQVFINGATVGNCDNMFIDHTFDVTDKIKCGSENNIAVHIRSGMNYAREKQYAVNVSDHEHANEFVWQRKPAHSFGWDIMPRFPSAGIWRGVIIDAQPLTRITQAYYATLELAPAKATVLYKIRFETDDPMLEGFSVRVSGDGFCVEQPLLFVSDEGNFTICNPRLWWPRGYGEASLYRVKMELLHFGKAVDTREDTIGIRKVVINHVLKPGDDGEFLIKVNGCPILAKGSNWVPLDAMHSRDAQRYDRALALFEEANCNILRCWGGNVYEDSPFFDLCDRLGILVWQDFAMACAAYPQTKDFCDIIEREAGSVIQKLRNHPCILLWAGDNEVDEFYLGQGYAPASNRYNALTREVLPRAVRMHDPFRMFLPSSPYIPEGIQRYEVPEQHNWGERAWFKDDFYRLSTAHFISECGYHGCPCPNSLMKFIPPEKLWPYKNSAWDTHNTEYLLHAPRGYNRNQLMADQVNILFGKIPDTLEAFSLLSQVSQAEALKFFIERTRIKKWRRTGIIWWNMLDGWPQVSDAVVDYYFEKKRAFEYVKRVQAPICLMLDELSDWTQRVILGNDSRETHQTDYRILDGDSGEVIQSGSALSPANQNTDLGALRVTPGQKSLFLMEWTVDGKRHCNHYITGYPPYDAEQMKAWLKKIDFFTSGKLG